jgi:copper chaperone CopZ
MKKIAFFISTILLVGACSSNSEEVKTEINYSETIIETVGENKGMAESTIEIKGMSCEIMCGTTIKNAVSELSGIAMVDIDFDMERETNFCKVKFDQTITPEIIVAKIESLNKGAYQVLGVKTDKWIEKQEVEQSEDTEEQKTAYINLGDLIPSVFQVVTTVLK